MLRSLRGRLVVSHAVPTLLVVPLLGLALIYVIESQVLIPSIASDVTDQAHLAAMASRMSGAFAGQERGQDVARQIAATMDDRLQLIDTTGRLVASSDPADAPLIGDRLDLQSVAAALAGSDVVRTTYSRNLSSEVADVFVPVLADDGQVLGVVRVTRRLSSVVDVFVRLRYLIAGLLAVGLLLGAGVGSALALNIERPITMLTGAIGDLAGGRRREPLVLTGPDEMVHLVGAFNDLVTRLRALEAGRRQLLANLVHELGRPLGALRSAIEAMLRGADEDPALRKELLTGMEREIQRLRRLLDDLAGLHDQVLGQLELTFVRTDLRPWLIQTLAPWRSLAEAKNVSWSLETLDSLPLVEIDTDRLGQVVGNIVDNALKYINAGGSVTIRAGATTSEIRIEISDTGPGIPLGEQSAVFDPLYRGQTGRRFPQGMGLGLPIAADIVKAHGGRIDLESEVGRGSTFTIHIPLDRAPKKRSGSPADRSA